MNVANTTMMNLKREATNRGWVFYDGECPLCVASAKKFTLLLSRHGFELAPLQTPWVQERLGLKPGEPLAEMQLLTTEEKIFGGADAVIQIAQKIWWAWPLYAVSFLPGVKTLLHTLYRGIAARRNCIGGSCKIESTGKFFISDWIPLVIMPIVVWLLTSHVAAWITCWGLVLAVVWGFKWPAWRKYERRFNGGNFASFIAFFSWPGMDAKVFLEQKRVPQRISPAEWLAAGVKIIFGAVLIWEAARFFMNQPLLAGWIGMIGLVFQLHFGLFHFLTLIYRRAGIAVEPIMRAPILSQSLGEFWGKRWNLAFNKLAYDFGFAPLRRRLGIAGATLVVFATSGLIHELVISVPARGGYGLPTIYFLIQGLGIIFERTVLGKRLGLGRNLSGWLFTFICTAGPAFWLFHPPFVRNVILPMLHAIGAI